MSFRIDRSKIKVQEFKKFVPQLRQEVGGVVTREDRRELGATVAVEPSVVEFDGISGKDLAAIRAEVRDRPCVAIEAEQVLTLFPDYEIGDVEAGLAPVATEAVDVAKIGAVVVEL